MVQKIIDRLPNDPKYFEIKQQLRRSALDTGGGNKIATIIAVTVILLIVGSQLIMSSRYVQVAYLMMILPFLSTFLLPAMVSPVIAGEYQRRSLEQLLAAPLSAGEIVYGKALRAVVPALMMLGIVLFMILLVAFGKIFYGHEPDSTVHSPFFSIPVMTIIFLTWSFFVTGSTIYVSSVTKSTSAALLASVGIQVGIFFVVPAIVLPVSSVVFGPQAAGYLGSVHPAGVMMFAVTKDVGGQLNPGWVITLAIIANAIYVALGILFLIMAGRKLATYRKTGFEN